MAKSFSGSIWVCSALTLVAIVCWRTTAYPYTKVEESFTIQAVHDIVVYGIGKAALPRYDHQVFAGAVPRSFVGPGLLALISYPWLQLLRLLGVTSSSKDLQVVIRLVLGLVNACTLIWFGRACFVRNPHFESPEEEKSEHKRDVVTTTTSISVNESKARQRKGPRPDTTIPPMTENRAVSRIQLQADGTAEALFLLISASQFHVAFWCSRTIPNSLAFPFVVSALALVVRNLDATTLPSQASRDYCLALFLLTFSAIVLRLEIVAVLAPVGLYLLFTRRINLVRGVVIGFISGGFSVLTTTVIDTYFWQNLSHASPHGIVKAYVLSLRGLIDGRGRPLWPEFEGFLFNVVEGKSSEWGVSPWHGYLTSFLPRLLGLTTLLLPFGLTRLSRSTTFMLVVAGSQIAVLSLLGHKEWRFVVYCVPALNTVSAAGARKLASSQAGLCLIALLLTLQLGSSELMGYISGLNYPGGVALSRFHDLVHQKYVNMHIDVLPAQTGTTLFQSVHLSQYDFSHSGMNWTYDKVEDLPTQGPEAQDIWTQYTHLLSDQPQCKVLQAVSDEQQPFVSMTDPVQTYAGLRRKSMRAIRQDLFRLSTRLPVLSSIKHTCTASLGEIFEFLLPVEIVQVDAIWLCRRKDVAE